MCLYIKGWNSYGVDRSPESLTNFVANRGWGKGADLLIALDFNLEIDENFVVSDSFSQNSLVQNERMCNFAPAIETESHEIILITI